jgi:putative sterol carrier protein
VQLAAPRREPSAALRAELLAHPPPAVTDLQRDKKVAPATAPKPPAKVPPAAASALDPSLVARLRAALEGFCESVGSDAAFRAAAAGKDLALQFSLLDARLTLHLALRGERARAALGEANPPAEVTLRMNAAIFDGMLSGRVNAMQEAISGGIAFAGDAAKAMALQQLQPELQRVWIAARASAGDLSGLAAPPNAGPRAGTGA